MPSWSLAVEAADKSWCLSVAVLFELLKGHSVLCMAQRYESLKEVLFREIKSRVYEWGIQDMFTFKDNPVRAYCKNGAVAYGGSYDNPDMCRGLSDIHMLALDEVCLADPNILAILSPCLRGKDVKETRIIGASTPRQGSMWNVWFQEAEQRDWEIVTCSTFDNTFLSNESLQTIVDSIDSEEMRRQELYGELLNGNDATKIIRLDEFPQEPAPTNDYRVIAGLDCADQVERDCTAFVVRKGNTILDMWKSSTMSHEEVAHKVIEAIRKYKIQVLNMDAALSDYEYNVLKYETGCEQVHFARAASEEGKDKYANVRSEMYFNLAYQIKHGLCVNGFDLTGELKRQLCAISWLYNKQGRLLLTPKEDLRTVLKMSTDIADALALTCLDRYTGDDPVINASNNRINREKTRKYAAMMGR